MFIKADIGVIGGGPAGLAAACEAARLQAKVVVIDENSQPGGQLTKQIHKFFGASSHGAGTRGIDLAGKLVDEAMSLGVLFISGAVVYAIFDGGRIVEFHDELATHALDARHLILATGASENALAFPGWTKPGVMTAGALQTMMNIHRVLPARRILMVGAGNVGLIVSYQAMQAGAEIVAVLEAEPHVGGYSVHATKLERMGVPILTSTTLSRVMGERLVHKAEIVSLSETRQCIPGSERWLDTDLVCLAVGLSPLVELPAMAGCRLEYSPVLGGLVPWHDRNMRTSLPSLFVAGDVSGVEEASTAIEQGRLAGIGAAESLGLISPAAAKVQKEDIYGNLNLLRSGSKGKLIAVAKARLSGYERECFAPAPEPPQQPALQPRKPNGGHGVAIIECPEQIPCNPCVQACPFDAISIAGGITALPILDPGLCTGCGSCVPRCPGMAIYVLNRNYAPGKAALAIPYEFLPLPIEGQTAEVVDRRGGYVCQGQVAKIRIVKDYDRTPVITVRFPVEYVDAARFIRRLTHEQP